jgi:hypothetical protein
LAEVFRTSFASLIANRDGVRRAVIRNYLGMIYREIGGVLFEVADRITAQFHHFLYESVGMRDCGSGIVDEHGLLFAPIFGEARAFVVLEGPDVKLSYALSALFQCRLRAAAIAMLADRLVVFRPKLGAKLLSSLLLDEHPCSECYRQDDYYNQNRF